MPGTYSKQIWFSRFFFRNCRIKKITKKNNIKPDDIIMAVPSNGLHSNGYSMVEIF